MSKRLKHDIHDEIYLAGERVRPGVYFQVDSARRVRFDIEDTLPASLDGKVACYRRVAATWAELSDKAA